MVSATTIFLKDARRIKHTCVRQRGAYDWSKIAMRHTAVHRCIFINFDPAPSTLAFLVNVQQPKWWLVVYCGSLVTSPGYNDLPNFLANLQLVLIYLTNTMAGRGRH